MRIVLTGASGLIGRALVEHLRGRGDDFVRLIRRPTRGEPNLAAWDPSNKEIDVAVFEGADAVIHLSGEPIVEGRWSAGKKRRIRSSREGTPAFLAKTLARLGTKPPVMVASSAVGFYGNRGNEVLTETSTPGTGFLAEVCQAWEVAADPAREAGIRVVHARMGIALSKDGGALSKLLPPFRLGLGGPLGSGAQYISWIAMPDVVAALAHVIETPDLSGAVNMVAPNPVTNLEFGRELGAVLHRPSAVTVPAIAVRLAMGEMADEALLASQRVEPTRLMASAFPFCFPELRHAIEEALR